MIKNMENPETRNKNTLLGWNRLGTSEWGGCKQQRIMKNLVKHTKL